METISMFLDVDCTAGHASQAPEDTQPQSHKNTYASSGCYMPVTNVYDSQSNPTSNISSYDALWLEAANWDLTELALPACHPEGPSESHIENAVSPPTSSCWSFSRGVSSHASPDNSPTTINPMATIKAGFPLSTTVKLSDVVSQPRTDQKANLRSMPHTATNYASLLGIRIPSAIHENVTAGRECTANVSGWTTHASTSSPPAVLPSSPPNDHSQYTHIRSAIASGFPPASDEILERTTSPSPSGAEQFRQSPSEASTLNPEEVKPDSAADDGESNVSDSDDYLPSRSPSVDRDLSSSRTNNSPPTLAMQKAPQFSRKSRGKNPPRRAKGSAALALAVVTQLGVAKRVALTEGESECSRDSQASDEDRDRDYDPVKVYQDFNGCEIVRKRKNQPIPLPIPIPNLNKKSRGRKVPFVVNPEGLAVASAGADGVTHSMVKIEDPDDDYILKNSTSRSKRRKISPPVVPSEDGLDRSYVCAIVGCGKCFVRGEHLKRHVRSIHTHDKPHRCPIEGCNKSFSRRDNLGQHVRIHLQS